MTTSEPVSFATIDELDAWLRVHHATHTELLVRLFKKDSGTPGVTWNDLVIAGLTWGWIDGVRRSLDDVSFVQRLSPRRPRSTWSKKNCEHAERLIAEGRMQPSGRAHVDAARADGRWDAAYAGAAEMVMHDDLLQALQASPAADAFFQTLSRSTLFLIYHRVQTAVKPETRAKRIADFIDKLAAGTVPK